MMKKRILKNIGLHSTLIVVTYNCNSLTSNDVITTGK